MKIFDKKVFVTGASRGIGKAIAKSFRLKGYHVVGTKTNDSLDQGDDSICNEWLTADFTNINHIHSCAEFIKNADINILINNAGININEKFEEIKIDHFQSIQMVNVYAPLLLCQASIPYMIRSGWGRIVNISSIWAKTSMAFRGSYSASKFALDGLTIALAAEYGEDGILANCIAPGFIDTDLTRSKLSPPEIEALISQVPLKRLGTVEEVSRLVLWLASSENTFITGQNIAIDGGFSRVR